MRHLGAGVIRKLLSALVLMSISTSGRHSLTLVSLSMMLAWALVAKQTYRVISSSHSTSNSTAGGYPGPYCFQTITISYGGQTAQATIMDECMGCPWGGLDFSTGLFDYFASASEGVLYAHRLPRSGLLPVLPQRGLLRTSSTPQYTPPTTTDVPTTTWSPPASSTTSSTPPPTTTSTVPTTSVTTDATSTTPTSVNSVASGLAIPTAAATSATGSSGAIAELNNALIEIGVLLSASKDST
ncbi:hypothetical protein EV401DRAFT_1145873 [Pisolithus croceorrhizus]|nr:hypothetical protein EV401DRAFT_1145873 [Pisolithus croceorrhizus]